MTVSTFEDALRLFEDMRGDPIETARIAFLSPDRRVLGLRLFSGGETSIALPIRAIARHAIALDATLAIVAHNHPGGDSRPSRDDLTATRLLARGLAAVGVTLLDHLVIAEDGVTSFAELGYL